MTEPLGGQTTTVYERIRGEHREYRDGIATAQPGCSLQPMPPVETTIDGRAGETRRWKLFAPAGFRAASTDQATVTPGPVDDHGAPLRLAFEGTPEPHHDETGAEHHVTAVLRTAR